jgi:hypothetical protein
MNDDDIAARRHLEVMEALAHLSRAQQHTANEVLELREQLVPGLQPNAVSRYWPHFASFVALVLSGVAFSLTLGACHAP